MFFFIVDKSVFTHREFSFTLMGDIYLRYQSFENQTEFEDELCSKNPTKFDIGPVMTVRYTELILEQNIRISIIH